MVSAAIASLGTIAAAAFGWAWRLDRKVAVLEARQQSKTDWLTEVDQKLDRTDQQLTALSRELSELKGMLAARLPPSRGP